MTNALQKKQNGNGPDVTLGSVVDNIFQNSFRRFFDDNFWEADLGSPADSVPVNIRETEQHYELDVIAPGCRKEDFKVNIHDNLLTVSLNVNENGEQWDLKSGWVRNEYKQRAFTRTFTVDDTVDLNNIQAGYHDGILRLTLGKNEQAKKVSRNIEVK
ncbi:MAG TPA: Hsp20/alpha crystallin family protein [Chitinophagaceae bacterium]